MGKGMGMNIDWDEVKDRLRLDGDMNIYEMLHALIERIEDLEEEVLELNIRLQGKEK